jgi:hypothetical protein
MGFFEGIPFFGKKKDLAPGLDEAGLTREGVEQLVVRVLQQVQRERDQHAFDEDTIRIATEDIARRASERHLNLNITPKVFDELKGVLSSTGESMDERQPRGVLFDFVRQRVAEELAKLDAIHAPELPKRAEKVTGIERELEFYSGKAEKHLQTLEAINALESEEIKDPQRMINAEKQQHLVLDGEVLNGLYPATETTPAILVDPNHPQLQEHYQRVRSAIDREVKFGKLQIPFSANQIEPLLINTGGYPPLVKDAEALKSVRGKKVSLQTMMAGNPGVGLPPCSTPSSQSLQVGYVLEQLLKDGLLLADQVAVKRQVDPGKGGHAFVEVVTGKSRIIFDPVFDRKSLNNEVAQEGSGNVVGHMRNLVEDVSKRYGNKVKIPKNIQRLISLYE